jgi:class 3 adenylate cyclase
MPERSFKDLFSSAYQRAKRTDELAKSLQATDSLTIEKRAGAALGHPDFEHLKVGQTAIGQGVVFFLDIRGFTKLSFVLSNEELLAILQALSMASVASVLQFGGHVIEFTGDGVMAVFGDARSPAEVAAFSALHTTAFLMKGIRDEVNPMLEHNGTQPVRTGVGMEFGEILWSRIGILGNTQVKPISEATFLAGKLSSSKFTAAWEAKVGADLASWIPEDFKRQAKKYEFTMDGKTYSRDLFVFRWEEFGEAFQAQTESLRKRMLARKLGAMTIASAARTVSAPAAADSAPRLLKDQPFF